MDDHVKDVPGTIIPGHQEITSCPAAHGPEVNHLVPLSAVYPQIGCRQMLQGVKLRGVHDRLLIGACHAQVKSGYHLVPHLVLAGYIDPGL